MLNCQGHSINESWENAIRSFLDTYILTKYEGRETAVVHDMIVHIEDPLTNTELHDLCLWKESVREQYVRVVNYPHPDSVWEIDRLCTPLEQGMSQYDLLLYTLKNIQTDRPVFVSLYNPTLDLAPRRPLPCLTSIEFQKKRGALDIKAFFSVINLYTHGLLDMNQIAYLHTNLCQQLFCSKGSFTIYASHSIMNAVDCLICKEVIKRGDSD